ncbi:hypothetical protein Q7P37_004857 [Cladosporium fusiforme]
MSKRIKPTRHGLPPTEEVNARLRQLREAESLRFAPDSDFDDYENATRNDPLELPRFIIDLSLPPEQRYTDVCAAFREEMQNLEKTFDDVLGRLYCEEETAELQGISQLTKVPLYILVAFNLILDLLMGCSSGGAAVESDPSAAGSGTKMVHFRSMDWGMPRLRRLLLQQDFVLEPNGEIVASTIAYAGYVGVITGVRKGLSISLNFRDVRLDSHSCIANIKYVLHQVLVMLGFRPSIISILRGYLLPRTSEDRKTKRTKLENTSMKTYTEVVREAGCQQGTLLTSACYIVFSSGQETTVIEKDLRTANCRSSNQFIVATNADESAMDATDPMAASETPLKKVLKTSDSPVATLEEAIQESQNRRRDVEHNYKELCHMRKGIMEVRNTAGTCADQLPSMGSICGIMQRYPTLNEATHYSAVMDPMEGKIAWSRHWRNPLQYR